MAASGQPLMVYFFHRKRYKQYSLQATLPNAIDAAGEGESCRCRKRPIFCVKPIDYMIGRGEKTIEEDDNGTDQSLPNAIDAAGEGETCYCWTDRCQTPLTLPKKERAVAVGNNPSFASNPSTTRSGERRRRSKKMTMERTDRCQTPPTLPEKERAAAATGEGESCYCCQKRPIFCVRPIDDTIRRAEKTIEEDDDGTDRSLPNVVNAAEEGERAAAARNDPSSASDPSTT